jgi:hypothetical protein
VGDPDLRGTIASGIMIVVTEVPNNPLKSPVLVGGVVFAAVVAIVMIVIGLWPLAVLCVAACALGLVGIRTVRSGRNPWWTRAPLDYWWVRRDRSRLR